MKPTEVAGQATLAAVNGLAVIYERQAVALELSAQAALLLVVQQTRCADEAERLAAAQERIAVTLAAWAYGDVIAEHRDFVQLGRDGWGDIKGREAVRAILDQATKLTPDTANEAKP